MDDASLPSLKSSLLIDIVLEEQGDRRSDLGAWFTGVDIQIANMKTQVGTSRRPPAPPGYNMKIKVEYSLRNIIMMFVTTDDSASAEKKRGETGLMSNGAEEWLKEVVTLVTIRRFGGEVARWEAVDRFNCSLLST